MIVITTALFHGADVRACTCVGTSEDTADVVFAGEIISLDGPQDIRVQVNDTTVTRQVTVVTIRVAHVWRGDVGPEVDVVTQFHAGSCGYGFRHSNRHLIFAEERDGVLWTGACSGSKPYEHSAGTRYLLGTPSYSADGAESAVVSREQIMAMLSSGEWVDVYVASKACLNDPDDYAAAVARLLEIVRGQSDGEPSYALMALAKMEWDRDLATGETRRIQQEGNVEQRVAMYEMLHSVVRSDAMIDMLTAGFQDPEPVVRAAAIRQVRHLNWHSATPGKKGVLKDLEYLLEDSDAGVRLAIVKALWWIGEPAQSFLGKLDALRESDPDAEVREFTGLACRKIRSTIE